MEKIQGHARVDGPKMPFYSSDFFFEDFVPEPRFEFALTDRCGRDTHGFLPST